LRQDDRAPFDRALHRARASAYPPGEFVGQESFMTAGEIRALAMHAGIGSGVRLLDLCCGVAGPGRFLTRELGCAYLGLDASASAVAIARERAGDLPCQFTVAQIPPLPTGPFDVVLLLETMLAFEDKDALVRKIFPALRPGGRFAFTLEAGTPLTAAERAAMPDADTVWLTPLDEMAAALQRAGLVVTWQEDHTRVRGGAGACGRVRRGRRGHRRADRPPGAGRAARRPPAVDQVAGRGAGAEVRPGGGAAVRPQRLRCPLYVSAGTTEDAEVARSAIGADRASEGALEQAGATRVAADAGPARGRLAGLDGIRGLAALFVVVNHVFLRAFPGYPVDRAPFWAGWFIYGRFAVDVFIVLSGFSLALAPARRGWRLDGVSRFAHRRARRILPPYWAALAFSLAVAWLVLPPPGQAPPDAKSVLVNGLLVQNLVGAPSPNRSFWSLAVEAQLYVVFPLLLLMVRQWGAIAMVAAVTLVVATVGILAPGFPGLDFYVIQSPPDLAALFAIGVVSAGIVGAGGARRSWPWGRLALAAAAPVLALIWRQGSVWTLGHLFWVDLALGPAVACLLAGLGTGHAAPLVRLLDARPIRNLGSSSYSLYLTHGPIVVVVYERIVRGRVRPGVPAFVVMLALAVPLTIAFARVFASVFETPFKHRRSWSGAVPSQRPRADPAPG
jgi:peptidoglycan/LPS O-acetylase OafA/YrhL/SAM-dependent methyltransferase